jgi:hypothetical protein
MTQHTWAIVLFVAALVAFGLAAVTIPLHPRINLTALGLFLVTLAAMLDGLV